MPARKKYSSQKSEKINNSSIAEVKVKRKMTRTEPKPLKDAFPILGIGVSVGGAQTLAELAVLAAIVQSSEDAIILKDLSGIITHWNPAAERIYGYSASEAVGQHINLIIPRNRRQENYELVRRVLAANRSRPGKPFAAPKMDTRSI